MRNQNFCLFFLPSFYFLFCGFAYFFPFHFLPKADVIIFNERLQNYTWNTSRRSKEMLIWVDVCLAKYKEKCPLNSGKKRQKSVWKNVENHRERAPSAKAIKSFNLKSKYCNIINPVTSLKRIVELGKTYFGFRVKKKCVCVWVSVCSTNCEACVLIKKDNIFAWMARRWNARRRTQLTAGP